MMSARTRGAMPALLTRASMRPKAASVSSTMRGAVGGAADVAADGDELLLGVAGPACRQAAAVSSAAALLLA